MRYVYSADRLKNMLTYYKDTLKDISDSFVIDHAKVDCDDIFSEVQHMLEDLEKQASYEYDYALENTPKSFWKKSKKKVPKPSISIDEIIEYVKDNGLEVSGTFPYALSQYEESKMFSSNFNMVSMGNKHSIFPEDFNVEIRSFIVYHPETHSRELQQVNTLLSRINTYFEKVFKGNVTPDKYELNPDEQHLLDVIVKYIQEYNDKE